MNTSENNKMATPIFTLSPEMQESWDDVMGQMVAFVNDTNADVDMAYDWVCEMLNISSFVDNKSAWDSFYETWESCDNRNDLTTYVISWFFIQTMQNNYLTDYIESKGYTVQECYRPAKKEVPANMRHRYSTYEEYEEALYDFLNGM